jgi:transcriptional antiterminator RfaH
MQTMMPAWYCARTKPKHEHIATANLRRHLALPVFFPKIRLEKPTRRGLIRVIEPLFPCYVFLHCVVEEQVNEIQHVSGISRLVQFGHKYPQIADAIIEELQACFGLDDLIDVERRLAPGDEVTVAGGAFAGMSAQVLKCLPAKKRVQILLDILGRPTKVEVGSEVVSLKKNTLADLAPFLAAPASQRMLRV